MIAVGGLARVGIVSPNDGKGNKGMGVAAGQLSTTHVLLV